MVIGAVLGALWLGTASAQLALPGAVAPTPEGATAAPVSRPKVKAKPKAITDGPAAPRGTAVAIPSILSLVGKTLSLNGGASQVTFGTADKTVAVPKLVLTGEKISAASDTCRVESSATALALSGLGKPDGLEQYRVEFPACPIVFDVLDGAILVPAATPTCDFVEADCRVRPAGLWGQSPGEIGPDKVKLLERARAAADAAVRSNYKGLTASTKDRPTIMGFARDQAQFSSTRAEICRDYADEGRHGYCAARFTEARAALLHDRLGAALVDKAARKAAKDKKKKH